MDLRDVLQGAFSAISACPAVRAIGVSGGKTEFPNVGEGDVDAFIYCVKKPDAAERARLCAGLFDDVQFGFFESDLWGWGDRAVVRGVEVFFMFFSMEEADADIRGILEGCRQVKEGSFYPTGRLGMYAGMLPVYDPDGNIAKWKEQISVYPDALAKKQIDWALSKLSDCEGIDRCAARRDLTGYHAFWDEQMEAVFIALFARNRVYYPSRKRNLEIAERFAVLPDAFGERLRKVIALGAAEAGIPESRALWRAICEETAALCSEKP